MLGTIVKQPIETKNHYPKDVFDITNGFIRKIKSP